jgi:hypothetical protein
VQSKDKRKREHATSPGSADIDAGSPEAQNSQELSPVRVGAAHNAATGLETTPPPGSQPAQQEPDEFDALFGAAEPRKRPAQQEKECAAAAQRNAPDVEVGLQQRGSTLAAPAGAVGDGGASWRMKALKRAQQRAADEGRPLDAEVRQRFESAAALTGAPARSASRPDAAWRAALAT